MLSPTGTPTVTVSELALLCPDILRSEECSPVQRLQLCCDDIVIYSCTRWAEQLAEELGTAMSGQLLSEYDLHAATIVRPGSGSDGAVHGSSISEIKCNWGPITVELQDADSDSITHEKMLIPVQSSYALTDLLFKANHRIGNSILSVDTTQTLPDLLLSRWNNGVNGVSSTADRSHSLSRLVNFTIRSTQLQVLRLLHNVYKDLSTLVTDQFSGNVLEDVALQILFDVMVCESICKDVVGAENRRAAELGSLLSDFKELVLHYQGLVDPINLQLIRSSLNTAVVDFTKKIKLLLSNFRVAAGESGDSAEPLSPTAAKSKAVHTQFLAPSCNRFALLPLPVSTQAIISGANVGKSMYSASKSSFRTKAGGGAAANSSISPVTIEESASTGASSISTASIAAATGLGNVRKGIMSSLGNFLGAGK